MKVAIVNSNFVSINSHTTKGTGVFVYILIRYLARLAKRNNLELTAFASGDSHLPVPIESTGFRSSLADKDIGYSYHKIFENALVAKAFSESDKFDLYHVNIVSGETALSFAQFVKKPIIVTMHTTLEEKYNIKYLSLFKKFKNIYYVSVSNAQRKPVPDLNYIATIYHGVDARRMYKFDPTGGETIVWVGRAVAVKGINEALKVIKKSGRKARLFPLIFSESPRWIRSLQKEGGKMNENITMYCGRSRSELVSSYQHGKLFLFPILWEEPFGLVMIEAMACGTPVVAYARGSVPEVVVDGETGFIVNPSTEEIRGNYIIKKTGIEGLCEAVERIYAMPKDEYMAMRKKCRMRVLENFTSEKMASQYINLYKKVLGQS